MFTKNENSLGNISNQKTIKLTLFHLLLKYKPQSMKIIKPKYVIIGLLIITALSSCTTTRVASLLKSENDKIEFYTTKIPDRNYTELSYIQTDGGIFNTPQQLLNGLKKKAIELKADAVINIKYDFQAYYPIVSGTAIRYENK